MDLLLILITTIFWLVVLEIVGDSRLKRKVDYQWHKYLAPDIPKKGEKVLVRFISGMATTEVPPFSYYEVRVQENMSFLNYYQELRGDKITHWRYFKEPEDE